MSSRTAQLRRPSAVRPRSAPTRAGRGGWVLLALLLSATLAPIPASAQATLGFLELEERLVERQLDVEMAQYRQARAAEDEARARVTEAADALDRALADGERLDRLSTLEAALDGARGREAAATAAVDRLLARIVERRLRLQVLRQEILRRRGGPTDLPDPITGTWRLTLEGGGAAREDTRTGLLDLELQATEVRGTLGLQDGTFGSVRGTFVRGDLDLERVSAGEGLDLILEGTYDPEEGALEGTWRPAEVGLGNPGGGTWRAERTEPAQNESSSGIGGES